MMRTDQEVEDALRERRLETTAALDERILADARAALENHAEKDSGSTYRDNGQGAVVAIKSDGTTGRQKRVRAALLVMVSSAVVIVLAVAMWLSQPRDSWAQVVEAVISKPWMRFSIKDPQGKVTGESWLSTKEMIGARRGGPTHLVFFNDIRAGIQWKYVPEEKTVYRRADESGGIRREFQMFENLFEGLFRGDEKLKIEGTPNGIRILKQERRTVTEDGKMWLEYDLTMGLSNDQIIHQLVFRVDPKTKLPHSMSATFRDSKPMVLYFDFPKKGPKDIYDLGVPRDAKIVDEVPKGGVLEDDKH